MIKVINSDQPQTTIGRAVALDGFSANDFKDCRAELLPAPADTGIVFDTKRGPVPAVIASYDWQETRHTSTLRQGQGWVRTVEHLMSAINGLGIDNLVVKLRPCGVPHKDFAADYFAEVLAEGGLKALSARRRLAQVSEEFRLDLDGRWIKLYPTGGQGLEVDLTIDFPAPVGRMECHYDSRTSDYRREIAWARSFVASPVDADADRWERIRRLYPILPADPKESPLITYDRNDFLTPLRQPDEPARHKMLDFLGDIALLGYRLAGRVELYKPGHRFTAEAVRLLVEAMV